MKKERAYIAIGSNLGDRVSSCQRAIAAVSAIPGVTDVRVSSLYETAPVPPVSCGWFVNGVVSVETALLPEVLLLELQGIERAMGREPGKARGAARTIDLDLLLVGSHVMERPGFILPHPRLHLRRFVLAPLAELAPDLYHPVLGVTVRVLLERLVDPSVVRLLARAGHPAPAS